MILVTIASRDAFETATGPVFGQYEDDRVVQVSDADGGGNIEVWTESSHGECDGATELGSDCSPAVTYHRLERFGDGFIPYIDGPRPMPIARFN